MPSDAHRSPAGGAGRPVTVLTVDDQAVFRRTARRLIAATPGFEPIAEAASGAEALRLAVELRPDLILLDVRMPEMNGFETARRLAQVAPETVVVLISVEQIAELSPGPGFDGATGYLRKQDLSSRTLRQAWAAHAGR